MTDIMEGGTLDPRFQFSDEEDDCLVEPSPKKTKLNQEIRSTKDPSHTGEKPKVEEAPKEEVQSSETEPYSLEENSSAPPNVEIGGGDAKEPAVKAAPDKPVQKRVASLVKDAENIASLLDVTDYDTIYDRLKQLHSRTNRTDIVTNEILENGIEAFREKVKKSTHETKEHEPSATKDDGEDIFEDIETVKASILEMYPQSVINPNEIYAMLEKFIHRKDRVHIVRDIALKSIVQRHIIADSVPPTSHGQKQNPEILSEEDELDADLEKVLKKYPNADPDWVYKLLKKFFNCSARLEKVLDVVHKEAMRKNSTRSTLTKTLERDLMNDPLFKEMNAVAALFPNRDKNEIYAYLEAHYHTKNRVQVVTDELIRIEQGCMEDSQQEVVSYTQHDLYTRHHNGKYNLHTNSPQDMHHMPVPKRSKNATKGAIRTGSAAEELSPREQREREVEVLLAVFPDCDPNFLFEKLEMLAADSQRVQRLSEDMFENRAYPKLRDRIEAERRERYRITFDDEEFSISEFLQVFPDPDKVFLDESRRVGPAYKKRSLAQLYKDFPNVDREFMFEKLREHNGHYLPTKRELDTLIQFPNDVVKHNAEKVSNTKNQTMDADPLPCDIDEFFFMELLFAKHQHKINEFLEQSRRAKFKRFQVASELGELYECNCCCEDNILLEDMTSCLDGHLFCKDCVRRAAESNMAQAKLRFPCLDADCRAEFSLQVIKEVMSSRYFSLLLQRIQDEETNRSEMMDLVSCPFCNFATVISDPRSKVFKCLNPECLRDSCRICRAPNHIPQPCEGVNQLSNRDLKSYIEVKVSEAMVRMCWRCKSHFHMPDGCNQLNCSCGASTCYTCRMPIMDNNHFENGKCELQVDVMKLHMEEMKHVATRAKLQWEKEHPEEAEKTVNLDPMDVLQNKGTNCTMAPTQPTMVQRLLGFIPGIFRGHHKTVAPPVEEYEEVEVNPLEEYCKEHAQEYIYDQDSDYGEEGEEEFEHCLEGCKVVKETEPGRQEPTQTLKNTNSQKH